MIEIRKTPVQQDITKWYISKITNDNNMTLKIMSFLFPENSDYKYLRCNFGHFFSVKEDNCPYCVEKISEKKELHVVDEYKSDKHKEIVESLNYLRSKPIKTKQDRESIHTLEIVLKNFS
jgi:hypothetical protein